MSLVRSSGTRSCRFNSTSLPMPVATRLKSAFALLTSDRVDHVERDQVFRYRWFKTTTTSTVQRIQLPQDFEGNGYVTVQFLRDPASDELFLSPLSYGVAAFLCKSGRTNSACHS